DREHRGARHLQDLQRESLSVLVLEVQHRRVPGVISDVDRNEIGEPVDVDRTAVQAIEAAHCFLSQLTDQESSGSLIDIVSPRNSSRANVFPEGSERPPRFLTVETARMSTPGIWLGFLCRVRTSEGTRVI